MVSMAIRGITGNPVNHTATVIRIDEYGADRVYMIEALAYGLVLTRLSARLKEYSGKVWWLSLKNGKSYFRHKMGRFLLNNIGKGYDYIDLFRQLYRRVRPDGDALFCSETHYFALFEAGLIKKLDQAPRPGDLELRVCHGAPVRIL